MAVAIIAATPTSVTLFLVVLHRPYAIITNYCQILRLVLFTAVMLRFNVANLNKLVVR